MILRVYRAAKDLGRDYFGSFIEWSRGRDAFSTLQTFCLFIGHARSGHSLVGSIINAHRHAVISHELHILRYVKWRFRRGQLFSLILSRDAAFGELGREWNGYSYAVPGQFQGTFEKLLVIGDKKGGSTTGWIRSSPQLLDRLAMMVRLPIRLIHVVRNPYDNLATIALNSKRGLDHTIQRYIKNTATNAAVISSVGCEAVLTIKHESLCNDPSTTIKTICSFLNLDTPKEYITACASIVHDTPRQTRHKISWNVNQLKAIERCIAQYTFLRNYEF